VSAEGVGAADHEHQVPNNGCISALMVCGLFSFMMFGLWFSPGWANAWPGGLHRNIVWPVGLAVMSFTLVLVICAGVGAAFDYPLTFWPPARRSFGWFLACTPLAGAVAWTVFAVLHSEAVILWP
jgi:hypothetical protein